MQFYNQEKRQFEADILTVGCIAGMIRMVIAIYRDLPLVSINLDFIVDCSLCVIFLLPLILLRLRIRFEYIVVPFSFLMLCFLCLNWVVLNGIDGSGEYYFIGGIILIALVNNGRWLVFFVASCVLLEIGLLYIAMYQSDMMPAMNSSLNIYHYAWITVVVTITLLYHKAQFDYKRQSLREKKDSLELKIEALQRRNFQLEEQKDMLQESNDWLEKKIKQRSELLLNQRKSIEEYLSVTLFEVGPYLQSTIRSINQLNLDAKKTPMGTLLMESADHLQSAIQSVTNKLKQGLYYNPKN